VKIKEVLHENTFVKKGGMCKKIFALSQKDYKKQNAVSCDKSFHENILEETELVNKNILNLNYFHENRI
jgi:hypothetical protein